ncbi:bifunctional 3-(3-hydroxy-phenyl)propionate/3-hydroxycinnamic acid hydroxylase [Streptomyces sp. NBC_00117]|uniref:bifunctional 3-(3-hydroxy-phenyl)propionate/3-hydroxycinnamic acid hydroxylase n=1 Tax=Streptomyces sp. NBC_00117 TaxID=2975657 RepID=UPI00324515C2
MSQDYEVVVIGGGPVGAMALAQLGHAGVRALGVEREPELWQQARAVHFDAEAMRSFQAMGRGAEIAALTKPMCDYRMENEAGETLIAQPTGEWGPQSWHGENLFHQPEIDALLRAEVDRLPSVELRLGTTLMEVVQGDDVVRCQVRTPEGATQTLTARWVIACDGATSTVRRLLDIPTENLGTDDPWLVADGRLHDTDGIKGDMVFLGRHTRPALWIRLPGDRARMEFKVLPGDDPQEIATAEGLARISQGVLTPRTFDPERVAVYTFRARVAASWRVGNVFLAGDAAHQAPPMFGMGLCAGLRDVANLVWKLRLVELGRARPSLLDTYESERREHARYWVHKAATMATLIQTTDPEVAAQRDAYIRAHPEDSYPAAPALGPGLHTGPADRHGGLISAQPILSDGTRLDDLVGRRFLLAASPQLLAELPEFVRTALEDEPEVTVLSSPQHVSALLASLEASAVLVRPDRYVLGTAQTPAALEELVRLLPLAGAQESCGEASPQGDAAVAPS